MDDETLELLSIKFAIVSRTGCGASSFIGIESYGETRFYFFAGQLSFSELVFVN